MSSSDSTTSPITNGSTSAAPTQATQHFSVRQWRYKSKIWTMAGTASNISTPRSHSRLRGIIPNMAVKVGQFLFRLSNLYQATLQMQHDIFLSCVCDDTMKSIDIFRYRHQTALTSRRLSDIYNSTLVVN